MAREDVQGGTWVYKVFKKSCTFDQESKLIRDDGGGGGSIIYRWLDGTELAIH